MRNFERADYIIAMRIVNNWSRFVTRHFGAILVCLYHLLSNGKKYARGILYNDCSVSVYLESSFSFVHKINTFYIRCICCGAWESAMEVPMRERESVRLRAFVRHETEVDVTRERTRTSVTISFPFSPFRNVFLPLFFSFYSYFSISSTGIISGVCMSV